MASKNSIKQYNEDCYYHIYNRGVEKRLIFLDSQDYGVLLSYLKEYLSPKDEEWLRTKLTNPLISYKEKDSILKQLRLNNFFDEITLIAFCLMPNHFHLLIKQKSAQSIDKFMNSICIRYAMYFNRKYKRVGALFQDVYKAVLVKSDTQLLFLTSYIHRNPINNNQTPTPELLKKLLSQPSSFPEYLGKRETAWVHREEILSFFSQTNPNLTYEAFIYQTEEYYIPENLFIDN